ncbi:dTDP-4-dehydrorhamnose reductase [Rhizorhapis sp. SPR117]|uniref:dTDP-4-dehydrorhamnose reductase n=1 Tax=Rhizorhapis sp. SPR117 TaxID=2912611 RepID=UPI001F01D808|nr:dTDP-4-dehydrorhamnose reductase [Rhizorhapis sp. SPR117]
MRIAVTGSQGQVVQSLIARACNTDDEIIAIGRPILDLAVPATIFPALEAAAPDLIVSAAAYTAVDRAEEEVEAAYAINAAGAGAVAQAASAMGVPIIHLSTDYVFNGRKDGPYLESDPTDPLGIYGGSKLAGEGLVQAACANSVILRTAWVYSPFGHNFVKTMLRLAAGRDALAVVADQTGSPTSALDMADGILAMARNLVADDSPHLRGIFHMAGSGATSWAEFASAIFAVSEPLGGPSARVKSITTAEYPTPAPRPANSRLDCGKLERVYGIRLPAWETSMADVVECILGEAQI